MNKSYLISKLFKKYDLPCKVTSGGKEVSTNCLFHDDEKGKLSVNTDSGLWHCWSCGESGTLRQLIKRISQKKRVSIKVEDFQQKVFIREDHRAVIEEKIGFPEGYIALTGLEAIDDETDKALNYLYGRGIDDNKIGYYKIGYCRAGRYKGRIIVPVLNVNEEPVSFIARDYTGQQKPKVLTPLAKEGNHGVKDFIFNLYRATTLGHLVIGEGVFDAISLGTRGICLFGKSATDRQIAKLALAKPARITICLDPDAQVEANILAEQLTNHCPDVRIASLPKGVDPNSVDKTVLDKVIKEAKPPNVGFSMDFIGV